MWLCSTPLLGQEALRSKEAAPQQEARLKQGGRLPSKEARLQTASTTEAFCPGVRNSCNNIAPSHCHKFQQGCGGNCNTIILSTTQNVTKAPRSGSCPSPHKSPASKQKAEGQRDLKAHLVPLAAPLPQQQDAPGSPHLIQTRTEMLSEACAPLATALHERLDQGMTNYL